MNTRFQRQGFTIPCFSYTDRRDLEKSLRDAAKTGANSVIFEYDLAQQAAFFDASLEVLATVKGLRGVFIYNWHANAGKELGFIPEANPGAYVWNVYGKPAQDTIRRRFLK